MVINALTTNALKYGALRADAGMVAVFWKMDSDSLNIRWEERGGAVVTSPDRVGFGSRLLDTTVDRQFGGLISHDWRAEGLIVSITLPLSAITA